MDTILPHTIFFLLHKVDICVLTSHTHTFISTLVAVLCELQSYNANKSIKLHMCSRPILQSC